jgi:hypothetical protein
METSPEGRERLARAIRMRIAELETSYKELTEANHGIAGVSPSPGMVSRWARGLYVRVEPPMLSWIDKALRWNPGTAAMELNDGAWDERPSIMTGDSGLDAELYAIQLCVEALEDLGPLVQQRAVGYLALRYHAHLR